MSNQTKSAPRRATNVTLSETLQAQAKGLNINISKACENGLAQAVAQATAQRWIAENTPAMNAYNAYIDEHGLLLASYRQF